MPDEPSPESPLDVVDDSPGKLERAAGMAAAVLRHKQLLVAAMEMLREKNALSEEEEVKIVSAYETGTLAARSALNDLVEKLQHANLGKVVIGLSQAMEAPHDVSAESLREAARPTFAAAKEVVLSEARPYLEKAKKRLLELKELEAPTLQRLEAISSNLVSASKEIGHGLKGAGREAADEFIKRGKRWWMSAETEELEREFFDWVMRSLPKAERTLVHLLIGFGVLLFASGILAAAQEIGILQGIAIFAAIVLMLALGLMMINWGIKLSEAMKAGRGQIEQLARMDPQERRVFLARRWAERAQAEGIIDSEEARTVIEQTILAGEARTESAQKARQPPPAPPVEEPQLPKAP